MSTQARILRAAPDRVWEVLSDGWLYPLWVVGATRMRDVDQTWPQVGAKLHHSAGVWPVVVDDDTEVLDCEPGRRLRLRARGWPMGEAEVDIWLTAAEEHTRVQITEDAVSGPAVLVPSLVRHPAIRMRNTETLRRLAFVAENRHTP